MKAVKKKFKFKGTSIRLAEFSAETFQARKKKKKRGGINIIQMLRVKKKIKNSISGKPILQKLRRN